MEGKNRGDYMISFDFDYYKPDTIDEAIEIYKCLSLEGKTAIYYSGGTEIISQARIGKIRFDAAIDIKHIPECNIHGFQDDKLFIGSAVTLTKISDYYLFPLLSEICKKAADHTARNKITIGGNICGKVPYKEAILPFLLSDSYVVIAGVGGKKAVPITQIFGEEPQLGSKPRLNAGEFIIQIITERDYTMLPYINIKKAKQGKVDYPLVTIASIEKDKQIRIAFSGICPFPFRSAEIEKDLNNDSVAPNERINAIISHLTAPIINDILGSSKYREFVLRNALGEVLFKFRGENNA